MPISILENVFFIDALLQNAIEGSPSFLAKVDGKNVTDSVMAISKGIIDVLCLKVLVRDGQAA